MGLACGQIVMRFKNARIVKILCCIFVVVYVMLQAKITFYHDREQTTISPEHNASSQRNFSDKTSDAINDVRTDKHIPEVQHDIRSTDLITHVGFLKVHKAGSTTMQNLLFRFAMRHNLTILLPRQGNYLLSRGAAMPFKKGGHYDIFACHTVYSNSIFGLLPADSWRIGIIREPLERAISAAYYYRDVFGTGYLKRIPKDTFIESLVSSPEKFDPSQFSYTRNSMGKDFGFSAGLRGQTERINAQVNNLKKEFKLVMVMERFEESLVLLKRELKWNLEDVLFIQSNSHKHKAVNITDSQKQKFRDTNFLDYAIYDTFYPIFEEKVRDQGPSFLEEVAHFKSVLTTVKAFCDPAINQNGALSVPASKWNTKFDVLKRDCDYMKKDEILFIKELRNRHTKM